MQIIHPIEKSECVDDDLCLQNEKSIAAHGRLVPDDLIEVDPQMLAAPEAMQVEMPRP